MALLSAGAPDVVLAEAGAWPSAPRVVLQGYLLNEAPRMEFEAWLRPKCLARRRRLLRFFAIYASDDGSKQTPILVVVREFLRMFASEAKQPRNDNRDSSRTYLAMNLGTRNTTYKKGGRPAGAYNVLSEMCKPFEGIWPKSVLRNIGGHHPGYRRG